PTEDEMAKKVGFSLEGYREVTKVSKLIISLNRKNPVTQEEFIDTFTDNDGDKNDSLLFSGLHWMMWRDTLFVMV
ncbi:RNA polymerase sigma factor sigE, chloroplastic/mitochondrial, partial [Tanacetum coccineum]